MHTFDEYRAVPRMVFNVHIQKLVDLFTKIQNKNLFENKLQIIRKKQLGCFISG